VIVRRIPYVNKTAVDAQRSALSGVALPRRIHRQSVRARPSRRAASRPCRHRAGLRRTHRRTLALLPPGRFDANNAWPTCIAIAQDLTRAAATLAGRRYATARAATIRRHSINLAGRIARHTRRPRGQPPRPPRTPSRTRTPSRSTRHAADHDMITNFDGLRSAAESADQDLPPPFEPE
jgi:hypothetical protein